MQGFQNLKDIAGTLPIFVEPEQKEKFLFVLGAFMTRLISFRKGKEIMGIENQHISVRLILKTHTF